MSDPMTPAVPNPTVEALAEVLRAHAWNAAFGGCPEPCGWQSSEGEDEQDEHAAHVAAAILAARAAAPDALRVNLEALAAEWERTDASGDFRLGVLAATAELRALLEDGAKSSAQCAASLGS